MKKIILKFVEVIRGQQVVGFDDMRVKLGNFMKEGENIICM